ncbi:MAG: hypothetical protein JW726_15090 [Anaerolineales bacterium]|nr:hypothetical protein [Anaerolineales bacterium]
MLNSCAYSYQTSSAQICTGPSLLFGIVASYGTAVDQLALKTGGSGGTTLFQINTPLVGVRAATFSNPIAFPDGIYLSHTGSGAKVTVLYG